MSYPYVESDAEKIATELRNDVRSRITMACEMHIADDCNQVARHSSTVVRKKMHVRTLIADYRIVSGLRRINSGACKS